MIPALTARSTSRPAWLIDDAPWHLHDAGLLRQSMHFGAYLFTDFVKATNGLVPWFFFVSFEPCMVFVQSLETVC